MPVRSCPHGHGYYQGRGCPECKRLQNRRPGSKARGYSSDHQQVRAQWQRILMGPSIVLCPRCRQPIQWTDNWDLDHTDDRTAYRGPSHSYCNRARIQT